MPTYRLVVAYDGGGFRGYARQEGLRTVQGELDRALGTLLGEVPETSVAGRTDAGVHARGQVVSFAHETTLETDRFVRSMNGLVGPEVAIRAMSLAPDGFSARHSALWRQYRYLIDPASSPDPLLRHTAWHVDRDLDLAAMRESAAAIVGQHDFTSFCRTVEGKSNVRRVDRSEWLERDGVYEYWVTANAFCHQMVRSLVGHMYDIGRGFTTATALDVIEARDRSRVATVAPPHGLTFWEVGYPDIQAR